MFTIHPWPLSEVTREEADRILALQPRYRDKQINQLKADLASKVHERRQKLRALDAAR